MKRLRLYHRSGCHLCEEMLEQLEAMRPAAAFELERVDVDGDPGLRERYGGRVPVLEDASGNPLSEVFLDPATLMSYLRDA